MPPETRAMKRAAAQLNKSAAIQPARTQEQGTTESAIDEPAIEEPGARRSKIVKRKGTKRTAHEASTSEPRAEQLVSVEVTATEAAAPARKSTKRKASELTSQEEGTSQSAVREPAALEAAASELPAPRRKTPRGNGPKPAPPNQTTPALPSFALPDLTGEVSSQLSAESRAARRARRDAALKKNKAGARIAARTLSKFVEKRGTKRPASKECTQTPAKRQKVSGHRTGSGTRDRESTASEALAAAQTTAQEVEDINLADEEFLLEHGTNPRGLKGMTLLRAAMVAYEIVRAHYLRAVSRPYVDAMTEGHETVVEWKARHETINTLATYEYGLGNFFYAQSSHASAEADQIAARNYATRLLQLEGTTIYRQPSTETLARAIERHAKARRVAIESRGERATPDATLLLMNRHYQALVRYPWVSTSWAHAQRDARRIIFIAYEIHRGEDLAEAVAQAPRTRTDKRNPEDEVDPPEDISLAPDPIADAFEEAAADTRFWDKISRVEEKLRRRGRLVEHPAQAEEEEDSEEVEKEILLWQAASREAAGTVIGTEERTDHSQSEDAAAKLIADEGAEGEEWEGFTD